MTDRHNEVRSRVLCGIQREIVIFLARLCQPQANKGRKEKQEEEEEEVHWVISSDAVAMQSPKGICKILFEIRSAVKTDSQTTIKFLHQFPINVTAWSPFHMPININYAFNEEKRKGN